MKNPEIKVLENATIEYTDWCKDAIIFNISNGKNRLAHVCFKENEEERNIPQFTFDDKYVSKLVLNEKTLLQRQYTECPTCAEMLATGYGIEKVECEELDIIRRELNDKYTGLEDAFEALKPLLALLSDGYYLLGDIEFAPIDGESFFYNVPNEMSYNSGCCGYLYDNETCYCVDPFPAYLYPTQSVASINDNQVRKYIDKIVQGEEIRGLAYYEDGFVCALLDGHHKGIAAGKLGRKIKCLTIIKADSLRMKEKNMPYNGDGIIECMGFCGLEVEPGKEIRGREIFRKEEKIELIKSISKEIEHYELTDSRYKSIDHTVINDYVYVDMMCPVMMIKEDDQDYTEEAIDKLIENPSSDNSLTLACIIQYRRVSDPESAYRISEKIVQKDHMWLPYREAWKTLIRYKDEHTESLVMEYLIDNDWHDACWDVVNSYWD